MKHTAIEEIGAYRSALNEGDREYWTRQIIIRRLRIHHEDNQMMLHAEHIWFAKLTGAAIGVGGISLLAFASWLS